MEVLSRHVDDTETGYLFDDDSSIVFVSDSSPIDEISILLHKVIEAVLGVLYLLSNPILLMGLMLVISVLRKMVLWLLSV